MRLSAETTAQLRHADDAQWCSFLCVYGDPELQVPVALTHRLRIMTPKTRHLRDRPPLDERAADLHVTGNGLRSSNRTSDLVTGTGWSGYGHYWLVQWKDGEGEWLTKPKVTYFTVASDRGDGIAEPRNLHVSSTGGGAVSMAWDPVEGAKRYGVVRTGGRVAGAASPRQVAGVLHAPSRRNTAVIGWHPPHFARHRKGRTVQ